MGSDPTGQTQLATGSTRRRSIHVSCPCGESFAAAAYASINAADDPLLDRQLLAGSLHEVICPHCGVTTTVHLPLVYHDPRLPLFVVVLPETMRHAELEARLEVLRQLAHEPVSVPQYARCVDVAFGIDDLLRRRAALEVRSGDRIDLDDLRLRAAQLDQRQATLDRREEGLLAREEGLLAREEDLAGKQQDLLSRRAALERARVELSAARVEIEREREALRALALDLAGQRRGLLRAKQLPTRQETDAEGASGSGALSPTADGARTAVAPVRLERRPADELDRWRAGDAPTAQFHHEGRVFLAARPGANLERYRAGPPTLLLQVHHHGQDAFPVLVALPDEAQREGCCSLRWTLHPGSDRDRLILDRLAGEFTVHLDLFDDESRPVATWTIETPLAHNAALVRERVSDTRALSPNAFEEVVRQIAAFETADLLGRKQHNFTDDSFVDLPSPAAARLALGIVGYWSEPDNEDYLLLTKSFPLDHWRRIRQRVVARAVEFGLRLSDPLTAFALATDLAGSVPELLRQTVSSFAEVSLGLKTNDLDPIQEWGNWKALLADCVQHGVEVEQQIETLAARAARRAHEWGAAMVDETEPGGDLSTLSEAQLLPMLAAVAQRRDAALELCERGKPDSARPVFAAVCNMTRAEVVRVIPAMVQLGEAAAELFVQGLHHHKSFIRQGCALALGALRSPSAIDPLLEMVLAEPTRIWMEAARALGDLGTRALRRLDLALASADGEGRERVAWAMANIALGVEGRTEVERLSRSADPTSSRVAQRALGLLGQVSRIDAEVRGAGPVREQTIVRAFSRRFYESMTGDVAELTETDIVEQEEVLGDADILETLEVAGHERTDRS